MKHLLLLHGAIGASAQLQPLAEALRGQYRVHMPDFPGHGAAAANGAFSIPGFAQHVLRYMDDSGIAQADIFGYSMGGYVGMYLARHHALRVESVVTLATKYHWDPATAEKECAMLDADKIAAKLPAFADVLATRHTAHGWQQVLADTQALLRGLGAENALQPEDYPAIQQPTLLLLGDRDKMVTIEETLTVYRSLHHAQLGILPATPHPIEQVDVGMLAGCISRFVA